MVRGVAEALQSGVRGAPWSSRWPSADFGQELGRQVVPLAVAKRLHANDHPEWGWDLLMVVPIVDQADGYFDLACLLGLARSLRQSQAPVEALVDP